MKETLENHTEELHVNCYLTDFEAFNGAFYIVIFIISILGNGLLITAVVLYDNLKNVTTIFILNLAVSDLIFAAILPFYAVDHLHQWVFGEFFCHSLKAAYSIGLHSGALILTALSVGRFIFVIRKPKDSFRRKYVLGTCVAAWVIGITASITDAFNHEVVQLGFHYYCIEINPGGVAFYVKISLLFLLPFTIIVFCYSGIILMVFRTTMRRKFRSVAMMLCIVTVFFVCWGPYNVIQIIHYVYEPEECWKAERLNVAFNVLRIPAFAHCCMNPLLYMLSQKMRKHLYRLCRCETRQSGNPEPCGQSTTVAQNVCYTTANSAVTIEEKI